jgi:hypothetical protein
MNKRGVKGFEIFIWEGNFLEKIKLNLLNQIQMKRRTKMSLTKEQKKDLQQLSTYFDKVEKLAAKNNVDLDVYISEYWDNGYAVYATERVELKEDLLKQDVERIEQETTARKRKKVFEKHGKEKTEKVKVRTRH